MRCRRNRRCRCLQTVGVFLWLIVPLALVRHPAPSVDVPGRMQVLPERSRFICHETERSGLIVRVLPAVAESTLTLSCGVVNRSVVRHQSPGLPERIAKAWKQGPGPKAQRHTEWASDAKLLRVPPGRTAISPTDV